MSISLPESIGADNKCENKVITTGIEPATSQTRGAHFYHWATKSRSHLLLAKVSAVLELVYFHIRLLELDGQVGAT